jgi:hypothetical protein
MFQPVHSTASVASTFITMMEKKMVLGSIAHILIVVQTDLWVCTNVHGTSGST